MFIILTKRAAMPSSCFGGSSYYRVAVIELEPGFEGPPAMISERAKGVKQVVATWERLYRGTTERCAYAVAYAEAEKLCAKLNAEG